MQITNGTLKYGETRKIADFENKRADVELSFNVAEGADYLKALDFVKQAVKQHCLDLLGQLNTLGITKAPEHLVSESLKTPVVVTDAKPEKKKPPKMPSLDDNHEMSKANDPAEISEPTVTQSPTQESVNDAVIIITDAVLVDATTKQQQEVKNPAAIRKLITECGVKCPPGRLIDIPQDKRQQYLDGLKLIKPLA